MLTSVLFGFAVFYTSKYEDEDMKINFNHYFNYSRTSNGFYLQAIIKLMITSQYIIKDHEVWCYKELYHNVGVCCSYSNRAIRIWIAQAYRTMQREQFLSVVCPLHWYEKGQPFFCWKHDTNKGPVTLTCQWKIRFNISTKYIYSITAGWMVDNHSWNRWIYTKTHRLHIYMQGSGSEW